MPNALIRKGTILAVAGVLLASESRAEDLNQVFTGAQEALNNLVLEADEGEMLGPLSLGTVAGDDLGGIGNAALNSAPQALAGAGQIDQPTGAPLSDGNSSLLPFTISQTGANLANIIKSDQALADATQVMDGTQLASANFEAPMNFIPGALLQSAENFGNVIIASEVEMVDQRMADGTSQEVVNNAVVGGFIAGVTQVGRNTGNYVLAELSIGSGEQILPEGVVQRVSNTTDLSLGALAIEVNQSGLNIGNVMEADHVEDVTRIFNGEQIIENTLILNPDQPLPAQIRQSGVNIANLVVANSVDNLQQLSTGTQVVSNRVLSPTLEELTSVEPMVMATSSNFVNVLILNGQYSELENTEGLSLDGDGNISAMQSADYDQSVQVEGQHSQVGNAAEISQ